MANTDSETTIVTGLDETRGPDQGRTEGNGTRQRSPGEEQTTSDTPEQFAVLERIQSAHDETLKQLREELNEQRRKLSDLTQQNGAPGAKGVPSALIDRINQIQEQINRMGGGARMDATLVRIAELERKIGEGAPDPLLNEIVHRLAALEKSGPRSSKPDPRVDEASAQIQKLRERIEAFQAKDPRTDDVVLRLASIEGAVKRSDQDQQKHEWEERFGKLEKRAEKVEAETVELRENPVLMELKAKLELLEKESARKDELPGEELITRIDTLEESLRETVTGAHLSEISDRLRAVEEKPEPEVQDERFGPIAERLDQIEAKLGELSDEQVLDLLTNRIEVLEQRPEPTLEDPRFEEISEKVGALDERIQESLGGISVSDLVARLYAVEQTVETPKSDPTVDEIRAEVSEIREKLTTLSSSAEVDGLAQRLEELGQAIAERDAKAVSDSLMEETLARLSSLEEDVLRALSADSQEEIEVVKAQLAEIESKISEPAHDPRVLELAGRLRALESRADAGGVEFDISGLTERLGSIEDTTRRLADDPRLIELNGRLRALEAHIQEPAAAEGQTQAFLERLESLEKRLGGVDKADVATLRQRLEALEAAPLMSSGEVDVKPLLARIEAIESGMVTSGPDPRVEEIIDRLAEIDEKGASPDPRVDELATKVAELEMHPESAAPDPRLGDLSNRVASLEGSATTEEGQSVIDHLSERLRALEQRSATGEDPRFFEVAARLESIERQAMLPQSDILDELAKRLSNLEARSSGGDFGGSTDFGDVSDRLMEIESRLSSATVGGSEENVKALLHKESERWTQWARNTLAEVGELRQKMEILSETGVAPSAEGPAGEGLGVAVEKLGESITRGLNNSDVRALRSQMYFVYFTIGMLYALGAYFMFSYLFSS